MELKLHMELAPDTRNHFFVYFLPFFSYFFSLHLRPLAAVDGARCSRHHRAALLRIALVVVVEVRVEEEVVVGCVC
jgi:hypothetical protein